MKRTFAGFAMVASFLIGVSIPVAVLANSNHNKNADRTPPKLTYLHIESNNADSSVATAGDKVTLSLTANEKVRPIVLVETHALFVKATNTGGNSWEASYTVDSRDPSGKVDYLITLSDASDNIYICTSAKLPFQIVPRCLTTDGSSVTVSKVTAPPSDTVAPVIAPHEDVHVGGNASGASVTYALPTATDNVDASVAVACSPASGSNFALGTTTVTCNAHDAANNNATPATFSVVVSDIMAPAIAPHEDVYATATNGSTNVTYALPTATDNVDASVAVACSPASGSAFTVGSTTVTCSAHDAAGNNATPTTFTIGVVAPPPMPYTMASQPDESYLCSPDWENCFTGGAGQASIPLGLGSSLGAGTLLSVTIAKDENSPFVSQPWIVQFECFTDSAYTTHCPDWVQGNGWNGFRPYLVSESATSTQDNKHWSAYFLEPSHESIGGSNPITFRQDYYYRLNINDGGFNIGAYGNAEQTLPYYTITGMTF